MAIEEVIDVSVAGLGSVDDLAAGLEKAAKAAADLQGELGKGLDFSAAGGGADKLAASYEAAFAKIQAGMDKLGASMADLGKAGGGADAGAASLGKIADAEKAAAGQADAMAASVGRADDTLKGLGGSADASAAGLGKLADSQKSVTETSAGLKDSSAQVSGGLKVQADQTAALTALQADMADSQRVMTALSAEHASVMADSNAKIAVGQRLNSAAYKDASGDAVAAQKAQSAAAAQAAADAEAGAKKHEMAALGVAAALGYGVDLTAKLQTSVTRLYTTAGENAKNLPMMSAGILALSGQTNTSQAQLGQGAYMVESAGYHGQDALGVLKAAAEGAQAEGAPLGETANALTSLMNAYGVPKGKTASQAAMSGMDQIIAMVSRGKMTMAGAVGALPDVLPAASAAKLSFADVGGALSTMTSMGMSPDRAAQNLSHVITSIMNPNAVQTKEQQQLGLNPVQLQNDLGKQGLTGTLGELSGTVMKNMGPAGDVLFKTFNQSKSAAADAQIMLKALPPQVQAVAKSYLDGSLSQAQWNQEMNKGAQSGLNTIPLKQFGAEVANAKGFNDLLKSGAPDVQTYAAAMDKLLGGQTGLNVAMELTGQHMPVMKANTEAVAAAAKNAGDNVTGWSKVQQTLNFQLGSSVKSLQAVTTEAGQVALPAITGILHGAGDVGGFLASHQALTQDLMIGGGALALPALLSKVASPVMTGLGTVGTVAERLNIPGLSKLAGIGQGSGLAGAASSLTSAGGTLDAAGGSLEGAAAALKGAGGIPGGVPGAAGSEATAGERAAADAGDAGGVAGSAGFFKSLPGVASAAAGPAAQGLVLGMILKGVGDQISPAGSQAGKYNAALQKTPATNDSSLMPDIFGGFEGKAMSMFGLPVGRAINDTINGIRTPEAASAQSGFGSRFGIPEPGTGRPAAAPASSTPNLSGFTATLAQAMGKPAKVPPPDLSALDTARAKAASDMAGLTQVIAAAMGKPVKMAPPDLSALSAAAGKATSAGQSVGQGFASGISSEAGAVSAAGSALASDAVAAMNSRLVSHSPSEVTKKIGSDFDAGFTAGIAGNSASAKAASAQIGSASVASLLQGLAGGQSNVQNAISAVMGAASNPDAVSTIQQTIATLIGDVPSSDTGLVKWLGGQQSKLDTLANKQGALMSEISSAQQLATSAIGGASITSAATYTPALSASSGPQASQSLITGMQQQLADTQAFAKQLAQLQKIGLNATTESQLAQAGTAAGLPLAQGLAEGGKGAVRQINQIESQIIKAGQQIGSTGGTAMYNAAQQVTAGLDGPLKAELTSIDKDMSKIANSIVSTVEKKLGTKTPASSSAASSSSAVSPAATSAVTGAVSGGSAGKTGAAGAVAALDRVGPAGASAAGGLDRVASAAASAAGALAKIAAGTSAPSSPGSGHAQPAGGGGYSGTAGYGGGGTTMQVTHNHYVTVQGTVMAQNDFFSAMQEATLRAGANNWNTGMIYPGRHN